MPFLGRTGRSVCRGLGASVFAIACASSRPSSSPLSAPVAGVQARHAEPSSSRYVDPNEQPEEQESQDIMVDDSDDDDGDDAVKSRGLAEAPSRPAASVASGTTTGASCTVPEGAPPDCSALEPDPSCLGASIARRVCESFGPRLDPRVSAAWTRCLSGKPGGPVACDTAHVVDCGMHAIQGACVDGSFHDACQGIARECADVAPEITGVVCERLLGAWKPDGRQKMLECLKHGCETGGFGACLP